jgi:hypothetical protein
MHTHTRVGVVNFMPQTWWLGLSILHVYIVTGSSSSSLSSLSSLTRVRVVLAFFAAGRGADFAAGENTAGAPLLRFPMRPKSGHLEQSMHRIGHLLQFVGEVKDEGDR